MWRSAVPLVPLALVLAGCATEPPPASTPGGPLQVSSGLLPAWKEGADGRAPVPVSGGAPPYECAADPTSPPPPGFEVAGCNVTGVAPILAPGTTRSITPPFRVNVTDALGATAQGTFQIVIVREEEPTPGLPPLVPTPGTPPPDEPPPGTPPVSATPTPPDTTRLNATLDDPTCTLEGDLWRIAAAGTASGPVGSVVFVSVSPAADAATPDARGATFAATEWTTVAMPRDAALPPGDVAAAGAGRAAGDAGATRWTAGGITTPAKSTPALYVVIAQAHHTATATRSSEGKPLVCEALPDRTPLAATFSFASCWQNTTAPSTWEIKADGVAAGPPGTTAVLLFYPVDAAGAVDVARSALASSWDLLPLDDTDRDAAWPAGAPVAQRARGQPNTTSWSLSGVAAPVTETDQQYRVLLTVMNETQTRTAEETVRCYGVPPPRSITIASATCVLVSTDHRQLGGSGPETGWTWRVSLAGNGSGRVGDRVSISIGQPYVGMDKSGGAITIGWTGSPSTTVSRSAAGWGATRATGDAAAFDWSVPQLTIQDWDYDVFVSTYNSQFSVLAQLYQDSARTTFTCPK